MPCSAKSFAIRHYVKGSYQALRGAEGYPYPDSDRAWTYRGRIVSKAMERNAVKSSKDSKVSPTHSTQWCQGKCGDNVIPPAHKRKGCFDNQLPGILAERELCLYWIEFYWKFRKFSGWRRPRYRLDGVTNIWLTFYCSLVRDILDILPDQLLHGIASRKDNDIGAD